MQTRLATSTSAPAASGCPSCGGALPRGAVLCTRCGFNLATGQRTVAGRPAPRGRAMAPRGDTKWYKTSYPYLGAFALVMLTLLLVGRTGSKDGPNLAIIAYLGLGILFYAGVRMMTVVLAFKDGAGTGFLCLCLEFYAIRWVYSESENSFLKASYPLAILLALLLFLL
jgi:hypothetical protein